MAIIFLIFFIIKYLNSKKIQLLQMYNNDFQISSISTFNNEYHIILPVELSNNFFYEIHLQLFSQKNAEVFKINLTIH